MRYSIVIRSKMWLMSFIRHYRSLFRCCKPWRKRRGGLGRGDDPVSQSQSPWNWMSAAAMLETEVQRKLKRDNSLKNYVINKTRQEYRKRKALPLSSRLLWKQMKTWSTCNFSSANSSKSEKLLQKKTKERTISLSHKTFCREKRWMLIWQTYLCSLLGGHQWGFRCKGLPPSVLPSRLSVCSQSSASQRAKNVHGCSTEGLPQEPVTEHPSKTTNTVIFIYAVKDNYI